MEPRWPASLAVLAGVVLYVTLPGKLTGPGWVIPVLELASLIARTVAASYRHGQEAWIIPLASLLLIAFVSFANMRSLVVLVDLVMLGESVSGRTLIFSGIQIWLTLILVFAIWYWELDRRGPTIRGHPDEGAPDFLFPQMATHELDLAEWVPTFVDYPYGAFTNATAFSPTDTMPQTVRAKLPMLTKSLASTAGPCSIESAQQARA